MFDSWKIDSQGTAEFSRNRYLLAVFGTLALAALAAFTAIAVLAPSARAQAGDPSVDGVEPDFVAGNPSCATLNADNTNFPSITSNFGWKLDDSPNGTFTLTTVPLVGDPKTQETTGGAPEDSNNSVTISNSDDFLFDWTATLGIDAVIVKGGPNADAFVYDPEDLDGDSDLHAPLNTQTPNPNDYFGISHIEFCYDYEVDVSKTANASFTRDWEWDIDKTCDKTELELSQGQGYVLPCQVTVGTTGFTDSEFAVDGTITVDNDTPLSATITSINDVIQKGDPPVSVNGPVTVNNCTVGGTAKTLPVTLAAGESLTCDYATPDDAIEGDNLPDNNHVDVTTSGAVGGGEADAAVDWNNATIDKIDECVDVSDNKYGGSLGEVCVGGDPPGASKTFNYNVNVGPYQECGTHEYTNVASFASQTLVGDPPDQTPNESGSDDHTVTVTVVGCDGDGGCTLTQGYWKTHSDRGPAPYDDAWKGLGALEEDTLFFNTGKTWYQVFWMPPTGGNAYLILAHQYQAALLNSLNEADASSVQTALNQAQALLTGSPPYTSIPNPKGALRNTMLTLAGTLAAYNQGTTGPGHCSEDATSSTSA